MADFGQLVSGFRIFKSTTYNEIKDSIGHVVRQGIKPKTLFVSCSDLRISPDTIFSNNPGESFVFRNMGSLIPPYESEGAHSIIAAIEYAVKDLQIESIVVLGHSNCDSVKMLMNEGAGEEYGKAMHDWLELGADARDAVANDLSDKSDEEKEAACEEEIILVSLRNLLTYPFVNEKIQDDSLKIYGWHFDIEGGELKGFNPETKYFESIG